MVDLTGAIRRCKPAKVKTRLTPREGEKLHAASELRAVAATKILLDTNVMIRHGQAKLPEHVLALVDKATLYWCTISISEICNGIAFRSVQNQQQINYWKDAFEIINAARTLNPHATIWMEAGLIAGTLSRVQNFNKAKQKAILIDALIYLTAADKGIPVLTENKEDFDLLQQVANRGDFYWY